LIRLRCLRLRLFGLRLLVGLHVCYVLRCCLLLLRYVGYVVVDLLILRYVYVCYVCLLLLLLLPLFVVVDLVVVVVVVWFYVVVYVCCVALLRLRYVTLRC